MHRLFVAIRPPGLIRAQLLALMGGVAGARWQDEDQLHLTVRFIGEVDGRVADDVDAALQSVVQPRFELSLCGLGAFERRRQPAVLWAGISPPDPVKALHKKIDHALARAGLEPERRAYHPHITLARLNRGASPLQPFLAGHNVTSAPFAVHEFRLYESRLTPNGAIQTLAARYPLG